uniref:Uncharacterized protein n=1 Tax=Steinernema glaseri TaxID=37863 RepID=A0A1I8A6L8_9BILA
MDPKQPKRGEDETPKKPRARHKLSQTNDDEIRRTPQLSVPVGLKLDATSLRRALGGISEITETFEDRGGLCEGFPRSPKLLKMEVDVSQNEELGPTLLVSYVRTQKDPPTRLRQEALIPLRAVSMAQVAPFRKVVK